MTRETKIGLFVGLTFIILFAVVISGRGGNERRTTNADFGTADQLTDAARSRSGSLRTSSGSAFDGRVPVNNAVAPVNNTVITPAPHSTPPRKEPDTRLVDGSSGRSNAGATLPPGAITSTIKNPLGKTPETSTPAGPTPGALQGQLALNEGGRKPAALPKPLDDLRKITEPAKSFAPPLEAMKNNGPTVHADETTGPGKPNLTVDTTIKKDGAAGGSGDGFKITPPRKDGPIETPIVKKTDKLAVTPDRKQPNAEKSIVHRTRTGDSLWKLCKQYYGRQTQEGVDAIFKANVAVLKDRSHVPADRELVIPMLAGYSPKSSEKLAAKEQPKGSRPVGQPRLTKPLDEPREADATAKENAKPEAKLAKKNDEHRSVTKTRPYEVRKNDTLTEIAQRQLGSSRRFKEIYDLNRDVLTSPTDLTPGETIKLPSRDTAKDAAPKGKASDKSSAKSGEKPAGKDAEKATDKTNHGAGKSNAKTAIHSGKN